ncbi:hypothetical protein [Dysosmobacter sp.]|uniref:hypothetical protein n=1 Tax=Dysosmobacter sp. TaxID=2591382 RepID=UPI003AEF23FD
MLQEIKKIFQPPSAPGNFPAKGCLFLSKGVQSRQQPRRAAVFGKQFGGENQ